MTAQPTSETQLGHARDAWDVLVDQTFSASGSTPFATDREQHVARFVSDVLFHALLDTDDATGTIALNAIHAERRRRMSAATREERRAG